MERNLDGSGPARGRLARARNHGRAVRRDGAGRKGGKHEATAPEDGEHESAPLPERVLWAMLRDWRFRGRGLHFRRRSASASEPASFVCEQVELVVCLDEQTAPPPSDPADRPAPWPNRPGPRVVHVSSGEVLHTPETVATAIAREVGLE